MYLIHFLPHLLIKIWKEYYLCILWPMDWQQQQHWSLLEIHSLEFYSTPTEMESLGQNPRISFLILHRNMCINAWCILPGDWYIEKVSLSFYIYWIEFLNIFMFLLSQSCDHVLYPLVLPCVRGKPRPLYSHHGQYVILNTLSSHLH